MFSAGDPRCQINIERGGREALPISMRIRALLDVRSNYFVTDCRLTGISIVAIQLGSNSMLTIEIH